MMFQSINVQILVSVTDPVIIFRNAFYSGYYHL